MAHGCVLVCNFAQLQNYLYINTLKLSLFTELSAITGLSMGGIVIGLSNFGYNTSVTINCGIVIGLSNFGYNTSVTIVNIVS